MLKVTVTGAGWPGAPSYNQYYFNAPDQEGNDQTQFAWERVRDAWEQLKTLCPNFVTHTVQGEVEILNHVTGEVTSSITVVPGSLVIPGVGTGLSLPPATAACLNHNTNDHKAGRKVRGRSFVSPISQGSSEADGTPTVACLAIVTAVSVILTEDTGSGENLVVWSRPVNGAGGSMHKVQTVTMPDRFAVLRSRRD